MGLFDGGGLGSIIGGAIGGIFGGREPAPQPTQIIYEQPAQAPRPVERSFSEQLLEYLPPILETIPRYQPPTQQEIILKLPEETKESGQMENGPQVYTGSAQILPFAQQAARQIGRSLFGGGGVGGAIGGAVAGYGVGQQMAGDACGCAPKPFVRLDKCGRPIITRAMQAKAKDMVQNCGMEAAAQMLGVDVQLLGEIAFKKFKPRAKGISGAQMKTTKRVNRQVMMYAKELKKACR